MEGRAKVNVAGLDKRELILALWAKSKTAKFFESPWSVASGIQAPINCNEDELDKVLQHPEMYADYLSGRVMKTRFKGDEVDPWGYDRENGPGAMQAVVNEMRLHLTKKNQQE